jgi:GNAT superfamily N-acetyltransferase
MTTGQSSSELVIRPIDIHDRRDWEPLWKGYLDFYQQTIPQTTTEFTWKRLTTTHEVEGLLALDQNAAALGLVHFLYHPSTSAVGGNCYIEDLFVIPSARGQRIGRRLLSAVVEVAKAKGVDVVYWQTEEFNGTARRLYERVAKRSPFIRYQIEL